MPDTSTIDRAGSLVAGYAALLLADLIESKDIPRSVTDSASGGGWQVIVIVTPTAARDGRSGLSQCARDILTLLAKADRPLSAGQIRDALEEKRIGVYALITVRRALAVLRGRDRRLVGLNRRRPRGYHLEEALPLVRRQPAA